MKNNDTSPKSEEVSMRPSYTSIGQAEAALDIFRRVNPKKIDTDFISNNNLATKPNAFKILYLYRWFGIIDAAGAVNAAAASKLRMVGEERDKFVVSLIKDSYKDLFEEVNVLQATKDDLINFFIRKYEYTQLTATFVASLFISLCQKYNIPLSENIKVKTPSAADKEIANKRKQKGVENKQKKKEEKEELSAPEAPALTGDNKYVITIKGKDGKSHFFPVNSLTDMEDVDAILTIVRKRVS